MSAATNTRSRRHGIRGALLAVLAVTALAALLSSCSGSTAEAVEVTDKTIILDVRTPGEYAEGHLDGAKLVDFNGGQFQALLPDLDPNAEYLVYCRSGNRSGQAVAMMKERGFSNVTDLGSLGDAADATGLAIVN